MASRHVLGIIFLVPENRRKPKTLVSFDQGKFGFNILFYEFRDFKLILLLCTCREKGFINKAIRIFCSLYLHGFRLEQAQCNCEVGCISSCGFLFFPCGTVIFFYRGI